MKQKRKEKIEIIILGNIPIKGILKNIEYWKSQILEISITSTVKNLPAPKNNTGYLNQFFDDSELAKIIGHDTLNLRIGIIFADLEDDFYVRRISDKSVVISVKNVHPYLKANNISIENFLKRTIYTICSSYFVFNNQFSKSAYQIPHIETRGCLFDLNGDINHVIYNTEQPKICEDCEAMLNASKLPQNYLINLKKELKKIRKKRRERLESFVKSQPYLSILISVLLGIFLNVIANFIYDEISFFKKQPISNNTLIQKNTTGSELHSESHQ